MSANAVYSCDVNGIISVTNDDHIYCEITPIENDTNIRENPVKNTWAPNPAYSSGNIGGDPVKIWVPNPTYSSGGDSVKNIWVPNPAYSSGSDSQKQPVTQTVMAEKHRQLGGTIANNIIVFEDNITTSVCPAYSQTTDRMVDREKHVYEDLTNIT